MVYDVKNMQRTDKIVLSLPERVWLTHWLSKTDLIGLVVAGGEDETEAF